MQQPYQTCLERECVWASMASHAHLPTVADLLPILTEMLRQHGDDLDQLKQKAFRNEAEQRLGLEPGLLKTQRKLLEATVAAWQAANQEEEEEEEEEAEETLGDLRNNNRTALQSSSRMKEKQER